MNKSLVLAAVIAATALVACGKKPEEAPVAPTPVAAPAEAAAAPAADASAPAASASADAASAPAAAASK